MTVGSSSGDSELNGRIERKSSKVDRLNIQKVVTLEGRPATIYVTPIQGSAADLIKVAMIRLSGRIREKKLKSKMVLQVHDELLFECPTEEKKDMLSLVKKEMEGVVPLSVPLVVDMGWGNNWSDVH